MVDGEAAWPRPAQTVLLRGNTAFVSIGASEVGFAPVGGSIELTSEAFEVETADGARVLVPAGIPLRVMGLSPRWSSEDVVDGEGFVRTRYTCELETGAQLFADLAVCVDRERDPYRDAPTLRAARRTMILAATADELEAARHERPSGMRGAMVFVLTMAVLVLSALSGVWR